MASVFEKIEAALDAARAQHVDGEPSEIILGRVDYHYFREEIQKLASQTGAAVIDRPWYDMPLAYQGIPVSCRERKSNITIVWSTFFHHDR